RPTTRLVVSSPVAWSKIASVDSRACTSTPTQRIPSGIGTPLIDCGPRAEAVILDAKNTPAICAGGAGLASTRQRPVLHSVPVLKWGCPVRATVLVRVED